MSASLKGLSKYVLFVLSVFQPLSFSVKGNVTSLYWGTRNTLGIVVSLISQEPRESISIGRLSIFQGQN